VASGLVTFSGVKNGYGNVVDVMHGNGFVTRYGHNDKNLVNVGETVTKGQTIALVGSTGRSTGNHVHFEVRKDDVAIDPVKYLRQDQ
jgi:murein DD-endopeptidase MepM/ murein hydrolase activator NlpD